MQSTGNGGTTSLVSVERRDDGVLVIRIDVPGESVNVLKDGFADELAPILSQVSADPTVKAAVIASGKPDNFMAGADIKMLQNVTTASQAADLSRTGQRALSRLEDLERPVVAAIHGACLGGGLEIVLACHGRVASDDPKTKLGLPEVQLGILPGLGGTQRLPRLIGVQKALDLMLTGRQIDARRAKRMGLVDVVVAPSILIDAAARLALELSQKPARARRRPQHQRPGKHTLPELLFAENPIGRKLFFDQARKRVLSKTQGNYPGPERILDVVKIGLAKGIERGLEAEAQAFGDLAVSPEAAELMNIFGAMNELKKASGVADPDVKPRELTQVGVLGAGLMGAGIAYVTATRASLPVRLKDRDDESLAKGLTGIRKLVDEQVERRRIDRAAGNRLMAMITPTAEYVGFRNAEIVIEAVFEDLALKQRVLESVEQFGHPEAIFATNTSSIPISKIAAACAHPERVIGMHYFSPVHKMPLLEVVVTDKTAPWVTVTAVALGKKQGKTVIVVRDGAGFYTTRILAPYLNEASFLLSEGIAIDKIDDALVAWGFPIGPLALLDEVGIDVGGKVAAVMYEAFGERVLPPLTMQELISDQRFGKKNKRGFYVYEGKKIRGKRSVDPSVYALLKTDGNTEVTATTIVQRAVLAMVNEAARCLGEGILQSPRDGDIGAVFGLGFPPFRGGPFRYIDTVGAEQIVRRLERYQKEHGVRFEPAPALVEMAKSGARYYGQRRTHSVAPSDAAASSP